MIIFLFFDSRFNVASLVDCSRLMKLVTLTILDTTVTGFYDMRKHR